MAVLVTFLFLFWLLQKQTTLKEGILGLGTSKSQTKVNIDNKLVNDFMRDMTMEQVSDKAASVAATQRLKIKGVKGDVVVKDVNFRIIAKSDIEGAAQFIKSDEVKKRISSMMNQALSVENASSSGFGSLLSGASKSEVDIQAKNTVINKTLTKLSDKQIDKCFATATATQELIVENVDGSVITDNVNFDATVDASAKCVTEQIIKNIEETLTETKMQQDVESQSEAKTKGVGDVIKDVGEGITGILGGVTGPIKYLIIGGVVLAAIVVIGAVIWLIMSGTSPEDVAGMAKDMGSPKFGGPKPLPKLPPKPSKGGGNLLDIMMKHFNIN